MLSTHFTRTRLEMKPFTFFLELEWLGYRKRFVRESTSWNCELGDSRSRVRAGDYINLPADITKPHQLINTGNTHVPVHWETCILSHRFVNFNFCSQDENLPDPLFSFVGLKRWKTLRTRKKKPEILHVYVVFFFRWAGGRIFFLHFAHRAPTVKI